MNKKLKILGFLAICAIAFVNINASLNKNSNDFNLGILVKSAFAESESCMKDTHTDKKPKTGDTCYCSATSKTVTKQTCEASGNGCTVISCD